MDAPIGSVPEEENYIIPFLETSTAGEDEFISVTVEAEMPSLDLTEVEAPAEGELSLSFLIDLEHRLAGESYMLRGSFSEAIEISAVDRFVVDSENYALYAAGEAFEAFALEEGIGSDAGSIHLPSGSDYTLVLANDRSTSVSSIGSVVAIVSSEEQTWDEGIEAVSTTEEVLLLPGEHLAIHLSP